MNIRLLEKADYDRGFLETLESLRSVGDLSRREFEAIYDSIAANPNHFILVAEQNGEVVGSLTLIIERKFIRCGGKVAHIEDVAVHSDYQGNGVGRKLMAAAIDRAKEAGCYKAILDCSEDNVPFYERAGFTRHEIEMRLDLPQTTTADGS